MTVSIVVLSTTWSSPFPSSPSAPFCVLSTLVARCRSLISRGSTSSCWLTPSLPTAHTSPEIRKRSFVCWTFPIPQKGKKESDPSSPLPNSFPECHARPIHTVLSWRRASRSGGGSWKGGTSREEGCKLVGAGGWEGVWDEWLEKKRGEGDDSLLRLSEWNWIFPQMLLGLQSGMQWPSDLAPS